jgi:lipopolysaccharide biosynthesis glycosyltransferase
MNKTNRTLDAIADYFDGSKQKSIIMLADRKFLPGVLMTLMSVIHTGSLKGASVVIMTSDPIVRDDQMVQKIARKVVFFTDKDAERFSTISRKHVRKGERHSLVAKYTIFKFFFFQNMGLGDQVFLDCDLIITKNIDNLVSRKDIRLAAAPALKHYDGMLKDIKTSIDQDIKSGIEVVNSGFMYACQEFLPHDTKIVSDLTKIASENEFRKEQEIVSENFGSADQTFSLPVTYNFLRSYMERIGEAKTKELEESINIVHYVNAKPWERSDDRIGFPDKYYLSLLKWAQVTYKDDFQQLYDRLVSLTRDTDTKPESTKIYLHLGAHKTGTTSLQSALKRSPTALSRENAAYLDKGKKNFRDMMSGKKSINSEWIEDFLSPQDRKIENVLISEEDILGFCQITDPVRIYSEFDEVVDRIHETFKNISNVKILFSIRNYADFIPSVYSQEVKRGRVSASFDEYLSEKVDLQNISWMPCIEKLSNTFGDNICIWTYEFYRNDHRKVYQQFGIKSERTYDILDRALKVHNPSLSQAGISAMRAINAISIEQNDKSEIMSIIAKKLAASEKYPKPEFLTRKQRDILEQAYISDIDLISKLADSRGFTFLQ